MPIANGESLCYNVLYGYVDFPRLFGEREKSVLKKKKINAFRYIALGRKTKKRGGKYEKNY